MSGIIGVWAWKWVGCQRGVTVEFGWDIGIPFSVLYRSCIHITYLRNKIYVSFLLVEIEYLSEIRAAVRT